MAEQTAEEKAAAEALAANNPTKSNPPVAQAMARNDEEPIYRYFRAGKADFSDDNTFQVKMSSEFPGEQRATKEHERLGIAKAGEKFIEILSHEEGDVDLSRFVGENRAPLLDEHKDNRHLGYIKTAALSQDKSTRGVVVFDNVSKLSKTRCAEVREDSRTNFSIGYAHTRYLGRQTMTDGTMAHRFAWMGLELSNVAVPMDPGAQKGRAKNNDCHCIRCGFIFGRKELNDDFMCEDCDAAETPAEEKEDRSMRKSDKLPDHKFTRSGGNEISFNDLQQWVCTAANADARFAKNEKENWYGPWVRDIIQDGDNWQAIIVGKKETYYEVAFTLDGDKVKLGDAIEVRPKIQYEPPSRNGRSVDSPKLTSADESAQNNLKTKLMPKTAAELTAENPEAVTAIRTEAERTVRAAVVTELETAGKKVTARNKEIKARADEFVKQYGRNWAGKPGEVVVVGERIRAFEQEAYATAPDASDAEVRMEFTRKCDELARSSRAPKNQEEAANLPEELAGRCSLKRLYNSAADAQARGKRTGCYMPEDGAEKEADNELRRKALDFPGGQSIAHEGVCLPVNMPGYGIRGNRSQIRRLTRDSLAGDFPTAGALIAPDFRFPTIELLRNKMALGRAGITILGGVLGNLVLPRQTGATTSQSVAEGAILTAYDQTFDQIRMTPHRIGSFQKYSRLALLQTTEDFEALVINDHMQQNALRADYLLLNGSGANDEPLGILNQIGIGSVNFGGSAANAYKNIIALETAIRKSNIDEEPSYITTSTSRGTLRITPATLTGSTVVSGESNALWVGEELVGRAAVDSQQVPGDVLVALVGRHVVMAQWGGWQVVLDTLTLAEYDKIKLSMNTYIDGALRHPSAVARSADSLAALT